MATALNIASDYYEIPLRSRSVSRVYVQSGFNLQLSQEGPDTAICIADPIAVVTENDPVANLCSSGDAPSFGRVRVSGRELRDPHRRLQIVFAPGVWFRVEPESPAAGVWGPLGSKGLILVCMPGGEIAIWFGLRGRLAAAL